jgi:biotin operon repressor
MHRGHVKVWRKQGEWEWYKDGNTFRVFHEIYRTANWKDKKHQGIPVKRGQLLTSPETLAGNLGLSRQQIRTSLDKLKRTFEITTKATSKYTMVTVCNYNTYNPLDGEKQPPKQPASNQQDNHQITTTKKEKNKEEKEPSKSSPKFAEDSDGYILAAGLYTRHKKNNDKFKLPNLQDWAKDADLMIRIDEHTPQEIANVIDWLFTDGSKQAKFWRGNVKSTDKLRKQFATLHEEMKQWHTQAGDPKERKEYLKQKYTGIDYPEITQMVRDGNEEAHEECTNRMYYHVQTSF